MTIRRIIAGVFLCTCALVFVSPQDNANKGDGLTAALEMSVDAFNLNSKTFEHEEIRGGGSQDHTEIQYFISNWEFAKDAKASIGYSSTYFGGTFSFVPQITAGNWAFGAKMAGWAQFSFLRLTLGNDIESVFADWQGSEDGMMIYSDGMTHLDGWVNPDNITDSNGLLLEALLKPVTIAAAAGDFSSKWRATRRIFGIADDNMYQDLYDTSWRYGARIGYELGEIGKLNLSYRISHLQTAAGYEVKGGNSTELVPNQANAQVFNHLFGVYGSFYLGDFSFTAGYLGAAAAYLSEYYNTEAGWVKTGIPVVYRNGIVLNALWKAGENLTLRTDNAFTFWQDKNYDSFKTGNPWDMNLKSKEIADAYSLINKIALRNGLGASYRITGSLEGSVYLQNSFIQYSVSGTTPGGNHEYILRENKALLELGLTYSFNPNASVNIKFRFNDNITSRSRDINSQTTNAFVGRVHLKKPEPVSTLDNEFIFSIPIGITLKIQ